MSNILKFEQCSFTLSVSLSENLPSHDVSITLTESEITQEQVVAALTAGISSRVRLQSTLKRLEGGIPREYTCSWEEYLVGKRRARTTVRNMTADEIAQKAASNPDFLAELLAKMQQRGAIDNVSESESSE